MSKNIILIGMRGSGKTTVARLLGKRLFRPIIDTDQSIERQTKMIIKDLIKQKGIGFLRDWETSILRSLHVYDNFILSTGGGIILKEENRRLLKKIGLLFYLKTSPEKSYERIGEDKNRPLLTNELSMLADLKKLYDERKAIYEKIADCIIDTDQIGVHKVVIKILEKYYDKH